MRPTSKKPPLHVLVYIICVHMHNICAPEKSVSTSKPVQFCTGYYWCSCFAVLFAAELLQISCKEMVMILQAQKSL